MDSEMENMIARARRHTLGDLLARTRDKAPDKFALAYQEQRLNYAQFDDLVNQTAQGFLDQGMNKGDMITVMSTNSLDFVITIFALARMGAVMIPINYMLSTDEVQYILEHAEVDGLIASETYAPLLDQAAGDRMIPHRYLMDVSHALEDRKSTRLNSSHVAISYAVFCLKKKNTIIYR